MGFRNHSQEAVYPFICQNEEDIKKDGKMNLRPFNSTTRFNYNLIANEKVSGLYSRISVLNRKSFDSMKRQSDPVSSAI